MTELNVMCCGDTWRHGKWPLWLAITTNPDGTTKHSHMQAASCRWCGNLYAASPGKKPRLVWTRARGWFTNMSIKPN